MAKRKDPSKPFIVQQITVKAPQRRVYDVGDWRTALRSADYGRPQRLYDLYDDVMIDGTLADAIEKRIEAVLNAGLIFRTRTGDEDEAMAKLIDTTAFSTLLREVMNQRFYGRAAVEFSFGEAFAVTAIKPKYIDLREQRILLDDTGERGIPYKNDNHLLVIGKEGDYGLLLKATPYAIWKRGGFGDYAQWIELFGMPQRIGKYNTFDPESRKLLEEAMEKAGSAPYVIIPKEAEVETRQGDTGSGSSFNEFRQACNEEILISVLGQTLTTIQGERGARSLGEVHMEVEDSKHTADLRFVQRTLNELVLPMFAARGYKVEGGQFVFPKTAECLSVGDIVQLAGIIDIPASYLYEKYAIPMPDDDEPVAGRKGADPDEPDESDDPDIDPDEPIENSDERGFLRRVWDFFAQAPHGGATFTIPTLMSDATLNERVIHRVAESRGRAKFDVGLFRYISGDLLKAVRKAAKGVKNADLEFTYNITDSAMQTAMEINLYRFSAAKSLAEIQQLNELFRASRNYRDFERKAARLVKEYNQQYQRTEYNTAYSAAEEASNYMHLMRIIKRAPYWEYVAIDDSRTRLAHKALNGLILPANDKEWEKIFPPNGWNCRCTVLPLTRRQIKSREYNLAVNRARVQKFYKSKDWAMAENGGWGTNRALNGKIFEENQFYISSFEKKGTKDLRKLYHDDWDVPSFENRKEAAKTVAPEYKGTADEWYKDNKVLRDYLGREVVLPEITFAKHTTGYYEPIRVPLLACIKEVLENPDEVWLNDYSAKFNNLNMIKFYKDKAINVVCEVTGKLEYRIRTWFEILDSLKEGGYRKEARYKYRRGLLIKK